MVEDTAQQKPDANKQQQGKALEEDDEFEEFEDKGVLAGRRWLLACVGTAFSTMSPYCADWDDSQTLPSNPALWEADWDDTSGNDNFAAQLQEQLQKHYYSKK